jgi:uncharacterized membrane protein (UPF0127 family)
MSRCCIAQACRRKLGRLVILCAAALLPMVAGAQGVTFDQAALTLFTQSGRHALKVDVAGNKSQVNLGLKYRHAIDPDGGLLIIQSSAVPSTLQVSTDGVWLPIDLLFLASDGTVREAHPWLPTNDPNWVVSTGPVAAALELPGGSIARYGIVAGDRVTGGGLGAPP